MSKTKQGLKFLRCTVNSEIENLRVLIAKFSLILLLLLKTYVNYARHTCVWAKFKPHAVHTLVLEKHM